MTTATARQNWLDSAGVAQHLWMVAKREGVDFNNEHWAVIKFLRRHYLQHGLPINARVTGKALEDDFSTQGGDKNLHRLFQGGPVTQGSRLANLRTPAHSTDTPFGTSY